MNAGQIIAEIAAPEPELRDAWDQMAEVQESDVCIAEGEYFRCSLIARNGTDLRPMIFDLAKQRGWRVRELTQKRHSLEDVYMRLTRSDMEES
jgi:hypothetical protein